MDDVKEKYDNPLVFIRGDGNANINNVSRYQLLQKFLCDYAMKTVDIPHKTYHHFIGNGQYDSNIDILAYSAIPGVPGEMLNTVICKNDTPGMISHHDLIISSFNLPTISLPQKTDGLVKAPRTSISRCKILWSDDGTQQYNSILADLLPQLSERWAIPESESAVSILLDCTTALLHLAATRTNKSTIHNETP